MPRGKPLPSQEYLRECLSYYPETGALLWNSRARHHFESLRVFNMWNTSFAGKIAGTLTSNGYRKLFLDNRQVLAHRLIWKWMTGNDPINEVDHWDLNTDNNKWLNLREATRHQNGCNRASSRNRTVYPDLPKGVSPSGTRYKATTHIDGKHISLGSFRTPAEASDAYLKGIALHHAEFANAGNGLSHEG